MLESELVGHKNNSFALKRQAIAYLAFQVSWRAALGTLHCTAHGEHLLPVKEGWMQLLLKI